MKCPGQDSRYWKAGAIFEVKCPKCGESVEFFKDDTTRLCKKCGHRFLNPSMDFGCAAYCAYAEQCIGTLPPELIAQKQNLLKDRVAIEMKRHFKRDFKRIGHSMRVARYAEQIGKEEGGNLAVILSAAYLRDVGREEPAEGTSSLKVRDILSRLDATEEMIDEVCDIVSGESRPDGEWSTNFKSVHDAEMIVRLEERHKENSVDPQELKDTVEKDLLTLSGKNLAKKTLIEPNQRNNETGESHESN
jgi:hypothetical protein